MQIESYQNTSKGLFWCGIAFITLGTPTILSPLAGFPASCSVILLAILSSGVIYIAQGFYGKNWLGFLWSIFAGILAFTTAGILAFSGSSCPCCQLGAAFGLVMYILIQDINRIAIAFSMRRYKGWKWLLASGIAGIALIALLICFIRIFFLLRNEHRVTTTAMDRKHTTTMATLNIVWY